MNEGELEGGVKAAHRARAQELGLIATNMPAELGGGGYTMLQQVLVQEQVGRATNALGWMVSTPPQWFPPVATPHQLEKWVIPGVRGEASECYAITEEGAGSDVDAIAATARRDGDEYVLNGVKWHVTSYNEATYAFFQAKLTDGPHAGGHAMFIVDLPSPGVRVVRTPAYSHTIDHHHPIVAFENVRVPLSHLVGEEGGGMVFAYEWFRFERVMVAARCLGAAERLIEEATNFAKERVVYGSPIIDFQMVQAMLADSLTELFAARSIVYETARGIDERIDIKVQHAQRFDGEAVLVRDGEPGRGPCRADLRRPRLHAGERRRALLPGAASRADLGGHERGPASHHRRPAREAWCKGAGLTASSLTAGPDRQGRQVTRR